ncbi:MAG: BamA/TamA family outer membrane protein [Chitinophagales bacterium]|nr:BamA/TamA family outer membrane protein [Chitinophagales bacterium]
MNRIKHLFALYIILLIAGNSWAEESENQIDTDSVAITTQHEEATEEQTPVDFKDPKKYTINKFDIIGSQYFDKNIIRSITGIYVEQEIELPGDEIAKAIKTLWKQGLFTDVEFRIDNIKGDRVDLYLYVTEKPRMSNYYFKGIKKGQAEDISKKITNLKGRPITPSLENSIRNSVLEFYKEKGYLSPSILFNPVQDSFALNTASLYIDVKKGAKAKISSIEFEGVEQLSEGKVRKAMKDTHQKSAIKLFNSSDKKILTDKKRLKKALYTVSNLNYQSIKKFFDKRVTISLFKGTKFNEEKYIADKRAIIDLYNKEGYRDASIVFDTVYMPESNDIKIKIKIEEGKKYYFRNIDFKGNAKYSNELLSKVLGIKKGDVYNTELLQKKLNMDPNGADISSLYYDDGYLFFSVDPKEMGIYGDSIDLEIRISEGPQANIKNVIIEGNDKTSENVIRRELRTLPGQKFSRTDLIRSQREIANLGFFDPQATQVVPVPNPQDGTVDIKYVVSEKSADQIELSAGWGGAQGIIGTLGLSFNNFSIKNIKDKKAWTPLPTGDGQKLSIRVQSNGKQYQTYNFSFTEPWLGGRKPNALSFSAFRSRYQLMNYSTNKAYGSQITNGASVALGTRLKFPDDYFIFQTSLNYQNYALNNFSERIYSEKTTIENGNFNNLNLRLTLSRNSLDQPLYPTSGSNVSLSGQFTLPYSLFRKDDYYKDINVEDKWKWVEYHKWRMTIDWYQALDKKNKLVFRAAAKFGFLGYYSKKTGLSPFERFEVGGNGLPSNIVLFGQDIISQRGYGVYSDGGGDAIFNKFTMELRYPFSLNPSATIYGLVFAEAGNSYRNFGSYDPFRLNKSVGLGIRAFLPMFGLLGVDYGIRFDQPKNDEDNRIQSAKGFFDYIAKNGSFTIILGFEPE